MTIADLSPMQWGWLCAAVMVGASLVVTCAVVRGGGRWEQRVEPDESKPPWYLRSATFTVILGVVIVASVYYLAKNLGVGEIEAPW